MDEVLLLNLYLINNKIKNNNYNMEDIKLLNNIIDDILNYYNINDVINKNL